MGGSRARPYMVGTLIASGVGAVLLAVFEFAGWYERVPYGTQPIERWYSIGLFSAYFPLLAVLVALLGFAAYVSYRGLGRPAPAAGEGLVRRAYLATVLVAGACIAGAAIFSLSAVVTSTDDWWLGTGFYGGLAGSGLATVFLWLARQAES